MIFAFNGIGGSIFKDDCGDGTFRITQNVYNYTIDNFIFHSITHFFAG